MDSLVALKITMSLTPRKHGRCGLCGVVLCCVVLCCVVLCCVVLCCVVLCCVVSLGRSIHQSNA
jgi:hypothetical protein